MDVYCYEFLENFLVPDGVEYEVNAPGYIICATVQIQKF